MTHAFRRDAGPVGLECHLEKLDLFDFSDHALTQTMQGVVSPHEVRPSPPPPSLMFAAMGAMVGCELRPTELTDSRSSGIESGSLATESIALDDARAMNRAFARSLFRSNARAQLDSLASRLPEDLIVYTSTRGASQVLATATGDLLPASCRGLVDDGSPDFESAARCFIRANDDLLLDAEPDQRGSTTDLILVENAPGGEVPGTEQFLRFRQQHLGIRVEHRSLAFVFRDGRLTAATGRYAGTAGFSPPPSDTSELLSEARDRWGTQVEDDGIVYNPVSGRAEVVIADGLVEHRVDAGNGEVLSSGARGAAQHSVVKQAIAYTYPSTSYLGTSQTTENLWLNMNCANSPPGTCDVVGTGLCLYQPVQAVVPIADKFHQVNVTYSGLPETLVSVSRSCGSSSVFLGSPFATQDKLEHYAVSARRAVDALAGELNHSESFFWVYPRTLYSLKLNVNQDLAKDGLYTPFDKKINLRQDPSPAGAQYARYLDVIAHEYGHYVHDSYGYEGTGHVREGWAETYPFRVAVHRRFVPAIQWPSTSYGTNLLNHGLHRYARAVRWGEMVQKPTVTEQNPQTWVWFPNSYCSSSVEADFYTCGRVMMQTYWALAWDQCKLNFMDCVENADVVRFNGGYQNSAWRLANSAYAYAIKNISGDGNVDEFHVLVGTRYSEFRAAGYIDDADEDRVLSLLASHCLGPANVCPIMHKLPGSPLPSLLTENHPLLKEAETGSRYGTATLYTGVPATSGGAYVNLGASGDLVLSFTITQTGTYRVHFVTKPTGNATDEVMVSTGGPYTNVGPLTPHQSTWVWRSGAGSSGLVSYPTTGTKLLYLSTYPSHMSGFILDAVWLEWVSSP